MPLIPPIRAAKATALSTALVRSNRCGEGGVRGSSHNDKTKVINPIGTLTANSQCQEATARIAAATLGPAADDTDTATAIIAMPRPNCRRG